MIYDDLTVTVSAFLFLFLFMAGIILNFIRYMHMFQLGSYHATAQLKWIKNNIKPVLIYRAVSLLCFPCLLLFGNHLSAYLSAVAIAGIYIFISLPKKAKKKLVFTPRVIRMCVTSAVIYGVLIAASIMFGVIPLIIAAFFTEFAVIIANIINMPVEKSVNRHYINDAKRIIGELPNLTVIGITGSYGKTSTKYFLNSMLATEFNVVMTPESYNTTMGVVKTVRSALNASHEIFICEMGAKGVGEIKEICDIVKPRHSMITSIGPQHLENFKSLDNIIKTKFEIADCISSGTVFLNFNNEYIRNRQTDKNILRYGISDGAQTKGDFDYYAEDVSVSEKGTSFSVTSPDGEKCVFETKLIGRHNVENIVGAIAVAHFFGVAFDRLKFSVKRLQSVPHRLELIDGGNKLIIDDAFNSNPSGARAALDALSMMNGFKILVTPGMVELGEKEYELNSEFGAYAAGICDFVILVGEKRAVPINEGLLKSNYDKGKIKIVDKLTDGLGFIDDMDSGGRKKIVLLENDLPDNY